MTRGPIIAIEKGDSVERVDRRLKGAPKVQVRRVVGLIKGPAGGILQVLYTVDGHTPAQRTSATMWLRWKEEAAASPDAARPQVPTAGASTAGAPTARAPTRAGTAPKGRGEAEPAPPAFTETSDLLTKPVQRICACRRVFLTRVVTQRDCPACGAKRRAALEESKRRAALRAAAPNGGEDVG